MPYIPKVAREPMGSRAQHLGHNVYPSAGQLNFTITKVILGYLGSDPHYRDFNEVIGVLECVKLEIARRMLYPYEDARCKANGDVFP